MRVLMAAAEGSHHGGLFEGELAFDMADDHGCRHHHHRGGDAGEDETEKPKSVAVSRHRTPLIPDIHWSHQPPFRFISRWLECAPTTSRAAGRSQAPVLKEEIPYPLRQRGLP